MTTPEFSQLLPFLLPCAAAFALLGWWLRGKKAAPTTPAAPAAKTNAASPSERQRLRDLEARLRTSESTLQSSQAELQSLRSSSVPQAQLQALQTEFDTARTNLAALEIQLRKSREVQTNLQSQANDAGKKIQARAITLENELAATRREIQRLQTLAQPSNEGIKRLEAEVDSVRTRLRAVEAQLAERNAEISAIQARALATTTRPPRTIASSATLPGQALNLLGVEPTPAPEADPHAALSSASAILGKTVLPDDFNLILGLPSAATDLLAAAGCRTWESLASTSLPRLRELLLDLPNHSLAHLPTWPEQARLALDAKWFQLQALQSKLQAQTPAAPETTPQAAPEPAPEAALEIAPEPAPETAPELAPDPAPEVALENAPEPASETAPT